MISDRFQNGTPKFYSVRIEQNQGKDYKIKILKVFFSVVLFIEAIYGSCELTAALPTIYLLYLLRLFSSKLHVHMFMNAFHMCVSDPVFVMGGASSKGGGNLSFVM